MDLIRIAIINLELDVTRAVEFNLLRIIIYMVS